MIKKFRFCFIAYDTIDHLGRIPIPVEHLVVPVERNRDSPIQEPIRFNSLTYSPSTIDDTLRNCTRNS